MSRSGSFGVNYTKTFTTADEGLPAVVGDVGSAKVGDFIFVQASGAIDQYAAVVISDDGQAQCLQLQTLDQTVCKLVSLR
jgi:hypothetical protein